MTEMINPENIELWNDAENLELLESLTQSMSENGWLGDPIVVIDFEDNYYKALTGSHRTQAAINAGLEEIPAVIITTDMITEDVWEDFDLCRDTDDLLNWIPDTEDLKEAIKYLKIENESEN